MLTSITASLPASAAERITQIPVRFGLGLVIAWSLHAAGQGVWVLPWLTSLAVAQAFEYWAMAPYRRAGAEPHRSRIFLAIVAILAMSGLHGGMALLLWMTALPVLVMTGTLILCGGLLNNVASGTDSRPLFAIGAGPYLITLPIAALAFLARGDLTHLPLLLLAIVLFTYAFVAVWRRMHTARASERAAREEAQRRLEVAELAMADRAAMAAIVSHELRTPVSAILAGARVIREGQSAEQSARTADLIVDAGTLMNRMLNDLLDHSKIEARAMALEARDFDLRALIEDTARFWEPQASAKALTLAAALPDTLWLKGDPHRIRQVLNNLLSNAIKFTEHGQVTLEATVVKAGDGADLTLTVRDQGAGITPAAMERLFTLFAQGSSDVARTHGGTGLGLTVSRDLARLMGGDLTVEARPEQGAVFHLRVHLPLGVETVAVTADVSVDPAMHRTLRVLAVDDHEINRRTLALVLEPLGVEFHAAGNGLAALEVLAARPFDIVLMDVNMPGIDGNETTRRLRAAPGPNAATPVIGFSAGTETGQIAACRAAGMTDWLPKPLEPARLFAALRNALDETAPREFVA